MQECFFRSRSVFKIFFFRISLSTSQIQMFYHSSPCFTYIHTYIYIYIHAYIIHLMLHVIKYRQLIIADVELPNNQIKNNYVTNK